MLNLTSTSIYLKDPKKDPLHVYPTNDLIEHDVDHGVTCQCNPSIKPPEQGEKRPIIIHNALDGRE